MLSFRQISLLSGAALVGAIALAPEQANAACTPAGRSLPSNTSVACTGTDTEGSRASTGTTDVTITVETGATVTRNQGDAQRVLSVYSNSRITNDGSVSSNGNSAAGMAARSGGNTLTNNGAITTSGPYGIGLYIEDGDGNTAVNNGTVTTTGQGGYGFDIESGNGNSATNNGTISTTGGSGYGFGIDAGSGNSATNNGTILTSGQDADGFHILGTGNEAINNGEIHLYGIESDGMDAIGSGHRLVNTGTITTNPPPAANQDSDGMAVDGNNNTLVNSGTVTVNGLDSNAFDIEGSDNEATNSNTLTALGPNGAAIYINGTGNSVTNSGLAEAQGATGNAALIDSVAGETNTLVNTATGTLTSRQAIAVLGLAGNDTVDNAGSIISGSGPAVDLGAGNDRLTMRSGSLEGAGAVVVDLGAGDDTMTVLGGVVMGAVDQGDGVDSFVISGGSVTGNVQQGSGRDDFRMTGGVIQSLNQGDNLDTFFMSGGRIVDAFEDGDYAVMTGGRIGRVNLKLDDNTFDMSGGTIDKNLVAGFGNDTIILSDGTIGGNISVSGGADRVTVTGGTVGGEVRMSVGEDTFTWDGGGIIYGMVDLGGDDDVAKLSNLTDANMGATPQITGGLGTDALAFDNVKTGNVARFDSWETVDLTNDSQLVFDGTLTLGDAGTQTGTLSIDAASIAFGGGENGAVAAFDSAQLANVVNAGRIDLLNGGGGAGDTFTVHGNYVGQGGEVLLNTVLGDDSSISDKLVIDGGTASGTTGLAVFNAGGAGGRTTQDGIMVVEAMGGATTDSGAFALNNRVAAGAYEYYLFKGGVSDNTHENWYLRSTLVTPPAAPPPKPAPAPDPLAPPETAEVPPQEPVVVPPPPPSEIPPVPLPTEGSPATDPDDSTPPVEVDAPEPEAPPAPPPAEPADPPPPPPPPPETPAPVPVPGEAVTPPTQGATPVIADAVPLYRIEVPAYSALAPVASYMAFSTLGTFHERRGEQILLEGAGGYLPATWGRVFGQDTKMQWSGTVDPGFDGNLFGFQAGQDLFGRESDSGHVDRFGLFVGYTHMDGDIKGQALGWNNLAVGDLDFSGISFGGYWTHIGPGGWYLDGVLMGTWFDGNVSSKSGEGIGIDGNAVTVSLEGGYPLVLSDRWTLEPQGQIIWNHLSLADQRDSFSTVSFNGDDAVRGRLGLRLQGKYAFGGGTLQPYLKANVWRDFPADQTVRFDADPIVTEIGGTSLEIGGGIVADLTKNLSLFATAGYTTNLGGEKTRAWEGNLGLNVKW